MHIHIMCIYIYICMCVCVSTFVFSACMQHGRWDWGFCVDISSFSTLGLEGLGFRP